MSVKVSERVWEHSRASGAALIVLLSIADHCSNDDGTGAYPGMKRLMKRTKLARAKVFKQIKALEALGELVVLASGSGRKTSVYQVTVSAPEGSDVETGPRNRPLTESDPRGGTEQTPEVSTVDPTGLRRGPKPYPTVLLTRKEPSPSEDGASRSRGTNEESYEARYARTFVKVHGRTPTHEELVANGVRNPL